MAAEAPLIAQAGDPHHHGVGVLALGEEGEGGGFTADLVFGIVQIGEELDLRHGCEAVVRHADGKAQDRLLVQQGVDHAVPTESLP